MEPYTHVPPRAYWATRLNMIHASVKPSAQRDALPTVGFRLCESTRGMCPLKKKKAMAAGTRKWVTISRITSPLLFGGTFMSMMRPTITNKAMPNAATPSVLATSFEYILIQTHIEVRPHGQL